MEFMQESLRPLKERKIDVQPTPARLRNKKGQVERKQRTIKDVMDRLTAHNRRESATPGFSWLVSKANSISNMLYGNRCASSFELARGYTPSIESSGQVVLPAEILEAQAEMEAKRVLSRAIKAKDTV